MSVIHETEYLSRTEVRFVQGNLSLLLGTLFVVEESLKVHLPLVIK
jgi:hypothetical protein